MYIIKNVSTFLLYISDQKPNTSVAEADLTEGNFIFFDWKVLNIDMDNGTFSFRKCFSGFLDFLFDIMLTGMYEAFIYVYFL